MLYPDLSNKIILILEENQNESKKSRPNLNKLLNRFQKLSDI